MDGPRLGTRPAPEDHPARPSGAAGAEADERRLTRRDVGEISYRSPWPVSIQLSLQDPAHCQTNLAVGIAGLADSLINENGLAYPGVDTARVRWSKRAQQTPSVRVSVHHL